MRTIYTNIEKTSRFSKGVRLYVIIFGILIFGTLAFLWTKLFLYQLHIDSDEQKEMQEEILGDGDINSEKAAQEFFEDHLSNMRASDFANIWNETNTVFDSQETVEVFMEDNIINSGYECYKATDYSIDAPKYLLMKDNQTIAEFYLKGAVDVWSIDHIDIFLSGQESFSATIPESCKLLINGKEVSTEYSSGETAASVDSYGDQLVLPEKYLSYTVNNLIKAPDPATDITVESSSGEAKQAVDGVYYNVLNESDAVEYKEKANAFIKQLLDYYSKGKENAEGNMAAVLGHVASGSQAAEVIRNSLSGVVWRVADYSVSYGTTPSDVYVLASNCFCVDIAYETVSESNTYETGNGVYRVYFVDEGNGYRIVQFAGIQ